MNLLIYAVILLIVTAIAATIYALATACDGHEDADGFHASPPTRGPLPLTGAPASKTDKTKGAIQALLSVH